MIIAQTLPLPFGWIAAGSRPEEYLIGIDATNGRAGTVCGTVASRDERSQGFGTLMQQCLAAEYRGRRLRLAGYLKVSGVTGWAGMWLRVDGPDGERRSLGFDNMMDRPLKGDRDWTRYTIVLDVPEVSHTLAFGVLLDGPGQVWIDGLQFDMVGSDVPLTGHGAAIHPRPVNLSFEQKL